MNRPFPKLFIGLASAMLLGVANAQTPSSTPVIGFYKQSFSQGGVYSMVSGFVSRTEFQGQASSTPSVAGVVMTINQSGASWAPDQFNTFTNGSSSHYVEVLDDANSLHVGLVLDITGNSANSLTVSVPGGFVPGPNFKYAVRKHATLGTVLEPSCGLVDDTDAALLLDSVGNEIVALFTSGGVWLDANDLSNISERVLYPGQGLVLLLADARTVTMGGGSLSYVKTGDTRISLPAGIPTIVGLINPLVASSTADPLYYTTSRNTLNLAGFNQIIQDSDFLIQLKTDGTLETETEIINSSSEGGLVNAGDNTPVGGQYLRNGDALIYIPGGDVSFVLPQRH